MKKSEPIAFEYRRHFLVILPGMRTLIYRNTLQGEGRARVNEITGQGSFIAATAWIDTTMACPKGNAKPMALHGRMELPRYIADDLGQGPNIYVIEHPNRGCYVGDKLNANLQLKPTFRWSIPRSDKAVQVFRERAQADHKLAALGIAKTYVVALHPNTR
jgi:hypothetical protein